jgi:hypothetical protein
LLRREFVHGIVYQAKDFFQFLLVFFLQAGVLFLPFPLFLLFPHHLFDGVQYMVAGYYQQEGAEAAEAGECFPGLPDLDEDVLNNFFRELGVVGVAVDEFVEQAGVFFYQQAEGMFVAGSYLLEQIAFILII